MSSRVALRSVFAAGLALGSGLSLAPRPAAGECEPPEMLIRASDIGGRYGYCGAIDEERTAWLQTLFPTSLVRRRWQQPFDPSQDEFGSPPSPGLFPQYSFGLDIDETGRPVVSSGGATRLEADGTWRPLIFRPGNPFTNPLGLPNRFVGPCTPMPGEPCIHGGSTAVRARGGRVYVAEQSGNVFEATLNANRTVKEVREITNYTHAGPGPSVFVPMGLDVDAAGGVYVAGTTATLFVPPPDASGVRSSPVERLPGPGIRDLVSPGAGAGGIAVDAQGRVFVVGLGLGVVPPGPGVREGELWMFSRDANGQWVCGAVEDGECAPIYRERPGDDVVFTDPWNVAIDEAGVLYVVAKAYTWDSSLIRFEVAADGQVEATTLVAAPEEPQPGVDDFLYGLGVGVNRKGTLVYGATEGHFEGNALEDNGLWQVYLDSDDDGACDYEDNCLGVANGPGDASDQVDSDGDGFGNACDADYTQDGVVGAPDQLVLARAFGTPSQPVADHDGDGVTGAPDLLFLSRQWGGPAQGRSGYECADRTICVAGNPHCTGGPQLGCPSSW